MLPLSFERFTECLGRDLSFVLDQTFCGATGPIFLEV